MIFCLSFAAIFAHLACLSVIRACVSVLLGISTFFSLLCRVMRGSAGSLSMLFIPNGSCGFWLFTSLIVLDETFLLDLSFPRMLYALDTVSRLKRVNMKPRFHLFGLLSSGTEKSSFVVYLPAFILDLVSFTDRVFRTIREIKKVFLRVS